MSWLGGRRRKVQFGGGMSSFISDNNGPTTGVVLIFTLRQFVKVVFAVVKFNFLNRSLKFVP